MSFKREGDDKALLRNLQSRRVSELLATHIPDNEALLLKNGRYTCLVCKHRPIFDTLDVLAIHRKGRKHIENLSLYLAKQQERNDLIIKRKQDQLLKTGCSKIRIAKDFGSTSIVHSAASNVPPLLKEIPYRIKCKRKTKLTDRKIILDITSGSNSKDAKRKESLPQTIAAPQIANKTVKSYLKSMKRKGSFEDMVAKSRNLSSIPSNSAITSTETTTKFPNYKEKKLFKSSGTQKTLSIGTKNEKADYYLNLCRDGWKMNADGTWAKDEQAEFDSDEEEPPEYVE